MRLSLPATIPPMRRAKVLTLLGSCFIAGAVSFAGIGLSAAHAQQGVPSNQDCPANSGAPPAETHATTPPTAGASSGTAPGGQGSTGWTGGTGGSYIGTANHASTPGSGSSQPETVTGANPGKSDTPRKPC